MLSNLTAQPQDKILALMAAYRADPREAKIDLGVGVYKDATGATPVMRAIKSAEELLWKTQETKAYVGLAGDPAFSAAMIDLVLGGAVAEDRLSAVATPGGTGAVLQALELVKIAAPGATVWLSNPTWPNHLPSSNILACPWQNIAILTLKRGMWILTPCWRISKPLPQVISSCCMGAATIQPVQT